VWPLLWAAGALATEPPEPVGLVFVASVRDEVEHDVFTEAIASFEAAHPGITVDLVPYQWQGYGVHDAYTRFLALEDRAIDVVLLDVPWVPEFARPGWLLPLDERVDPALLDAFVPAARDGGRSDGVQWGLPLTLKGSALYYRADLLRDEGLAPPTTLDELQAAAEALRDDVPFPIALHGAYTYNDVLPMWWASGGGFVAGDRPAVDQPANIAVVEELGEWMDAGLLSRSQLSGPWAEAYHAPEEAFMRGEVGFFVTWSTLYDRVAAEEAFVGEVGVTTVPGLTEGPGSSNLGSWYLAVSAHSRHPDAAVAFLEHMTSPEVQRAYLAGQGELPSRSALLADDTLATAHPALAALRDVLPRAGVRPRVANEREVSGYLEEALQQVVAGDRSAADALAEAQARIEAAWVQPAPPPRPELRVLVAPEPARWQAWLPLGLALLATTALATAAVWTARSAQLTTLRAKLMLFAGAAVLQIALLQAGLALSLVLREQLGELDEQRAFYRQQLVDHAQTIGRNLSLAASVMGDLQGGAEATRQLLMASHFSADLRSLQLIGPEGQVRAHAADTLFARDAPAEAPPLPPGAGRSLRVQERLDPAGQPYVEVLAPIYARGVWAGALRAEVSEDRYRAHLAETEARHAATVRRFALGSLAITAALLGLAIGVIVLLSRQLTAPIVELTRQAARIRGGDLDVPVVPRTHDEVGELATTMAEMVQGLRDRDVIKDAFGRYLSPALAERFLDDPDALQLGGQLQRVTILMSDLRGFTQLSERLGPERTVEVLNHYLGAMTEVILDCDGTINEFLGDAILVLFGAPFPGDDDAARAVRCAVRMQQAMEAVNVANQARGLPALQMGIGLCTGEVVAGNIGSAQRVKYGVVGDPINRAARIESLTVGAQVLMADATWREVADGVEAVGPMEVQVKGKAEAMQVWELRGLREPGGEVPVPAEAGWRPLALDVDIHAIYGKRIDPAAVIGRVVQATARRLEVDGVATLEPFADLKLILRWPSGPAGEAYGKVVRVAEGKAVIELTSMAPAQRERLVQALGAAEP